VEDWLQYEEMPDILPHVPNFENEKYFVERIGDKKDLVGSTVYCNHLDEPVAIIPHLTKVGDGDRQFEASS